MAFLQQKDTPEVTLLFSNNNLPLLFGELNFLRKVITVLVFNVLLVLSGCAASQTEYGAAKVNSTPQGAKVINLKDSSLLGMTPVLVSFAGEAGTDEFVTVQFRKAGYIDRIATFVVEKRHETAQEADKNAIEIIVHLEKQSNN